jgi:hypothetical protein
MKTLKNQCTVERGHMSELKPGPHRRSFRTALHSSYGEQDKVKTMTRAQAIGLNHLEKRSSRLSHLCGILLFLLSCLDMSLPCLTLCRSRHEFHHVYTNTLAICLEPSQAETVQFL